jgi:hypothetical protein
VEANYRQGTAGSQTLNVWANRSDSSAVTYRKVVVLAAAQALWPVAIGIRKFLTSRKKAFRHVPNSLSEIPTTKDLAIRGAIRTCSRKRRLCNIVTSRFFSFQENPPCDLEPAVHRVVLERGTVLELVVEA